MLDLSRMNQVLSLDIDVGVVTVQAGITVEVKLGPTMVPFMVHPP